MEEDEGNFITECLPMEIKRGDGGIINSEDYDIKLNNNMDGTIKAIYNKKLGCPVKFLALAIDQECGYVTGSKLVVYTSVYAPQMLNIVHAHINDMSDCVTLDVRYMGDGETVKSYSEFTTDISGQTLRYRVLVREERIQTILYNQGKDNIIEVPFEEVRV